MDENGPHLRYVEIEGVDVDRTADRGLAETECPIAFRYLKGTCKSSVHIIDQIFDTRQAALPSCRRES